MKKQERAVIVEVKRSGRKPLVKAVHANRPTILAEPPPLTPTSDEARRAADLLFAPRATPDEDRMLMLQPGQGRDTAAPRRVLPTLLETPPAEPILAAAEPDQEETPSSRRGGSGRRGGRLRAGAPRKGELEAEVVARALETMERLERNRSPRPAAGAVADLVEERRARIEAPPQPKRRGRPPKSEQRPVVEAEPRVWTSSKFLIEEPEQALDAPVALVVQTLAAAGQTARSRRSRDPEFKPGERWKRRLRGHAR